MPLTVQVSFKARLQARNHLQVPRVIRWQYKLETEQVLRVWVELVGRLGGGEEFYGRISRDGRLTIPRLVMNLLCQNYEQKSLVGEVFKVGLEPPKA